MITAMRNNKQNVGCEPFYVVIFLMVWGVCAGTDFYIITLHDFIKKFLLIGV